jgi:hypothetical protein
MAVTKKSVKKSARKSTKKAAKVNSRKRVVDVTRDKKIVTLLRKGTTTGEFIASGLYKSGSMLSSLGPIARRTGHKRQHSGKHGSKVYKFVADKKAKA